MSTSEIHTDTLNLAEVAIRLGSIYERETLLDTMLIDAMASCRADGGSLYLIRENQLHFVLVKNRSLNLDLGRESLLPSSFHPIPITQETSNHICVFAVQKSRSVNIADVYQSHSFDVSGTQKADAANNYRSVSMLTVPIIGPYYQPIGVLQLINAQDVHGNTVPFHTHQQTIVEAIANMAGVSYTNSILQIEKSQLFESFIQLVSKSLQHKSDRLSGLSQRLPQIIDGITAELKQDSNQTYHFDYQYIYEQKMALWIYKLNKLLQPTHITNKSTKLHMMSDRMEEVRLRYALALKDIELQQERQSISTEEAQDFKMQLKNDLMFLESCNEGNRYLSEESLSRIQKIAEQQITINGNSHILLPFDISNALQIKKGTLSVEDHHLLQEKNFITEDFLSSLPISEQLKNILRFVHIPYNPQTPLCVRILQFAQLFEALTTTSVYQSSKKLSEIMLILGSFKLNNQIDPNIFDIFVSSNLYIKFAQSYLEEERIDEVDTHALLSIQPTTL